MRESGKPSELNHPNTLVITQESKDSGISYDIDITPTMVLFENQKRREVTISLSNLTTNTLTISPKTFICELQPVTLVEDFDMHENNSSKPDLIDS